MAKYNTDVQLSPKKTVKQHLGVEEKQDGGEQDREVESGKLICISLPNKHS
jgi:hypothetical protein